MQRKLLVLRGCQIGGVDMFQGVVIVLLLQTQNLENLSNKQILWKTETETVIAGEKFNG